MLSVEDPQLGPARGEGNDHRQHEAAERRTYTPGLVGAAGTLTASDAHIPVPPLGEQERRRNWLAPVLHTMLTRA